MDLQVLKVMKRIRLIKKMDPIFRTHFISHIETKNECLIAENFISVANAEFVKVFFYYSANLILFKVKVKFEISAVTSFILEFVKYK